MDPVAFLAEHAPFDELSRERRQELGRHLQIAWARSGEPLIERQDASTYLYVIRKGAVRLELDGQRVDELGPGEFFGLGSMSGQPARFDVFARTDCLLYRFPGVAIRTAFDHEPSFARFFLDQLSDRLRALTEGGPIALSNPFNTSVGDLCQRDAVSVDAGTTVGDAAQVMAREQISSILVTHGQQLRGILTDRDLRHRVLARGHGPDILVDQVMSSPVRTIQAEIPAFEAMLELLHHGVHHLPVEQHGRTLGVLTHSDLLRQQRSSPGVLYKRITQARHATDLASYADDIATMVESLHQSRLAATDIGRLVAALGDALTCHRLRKAERDLGPPPCLYTWIVFGSEGRQEQSLLTDQDNALIYADDTPEAKVYFADLAERLLGDLVAVGFPPCAGNFMATHWCYPLARWARRFERFIAEPKPEALIEAANFYDFRPLHGGLDLAPLEDRLSRGAKNRLFLAQLTRSALSLRPPLGMLRRIREAPEGVDLKAGALMPIAGLARTFALEAGERHGSTLHRLATARRAGTLSDQGADVLSEAFRFIFDLRLRHQLRARREGLPIRNHVHLDALTPSERRHLKESFLAIHRLQTATAERFGVDLLG